MTSFCFFYKLKTAYEMRISDWSSDVCSSDLTSRIDRDEFVNMLLAQTSMEGSVSINLVCIGTDGRPGQRALRQVLTEWLGFRAQTMTRRTQYRQIGRAPCCENVCQSV